MAARKLKAGIRHVPPAESRSLRIYALDPIDGGTHDNCITVQVPFEPLRPGPIGERIEIIDYDPVTDRHYTPVDLDHPHVLAQDGLAPSESDPRFHQQMVYAVVTTTLMRFEHALGRRVDWRLGGRRLRVYPHGTAEANAYFSPDLGALVFGYFRASRTNAGRNLPGGYIFTCLSHDIIAHETTHALVHGLRDKFMEPTNPDTPAFHEAFADIVAILQHFSLAGVVENAIQLTRASLDDVTPLVKLGRQFGEAVGGRGALRSALGQPPDPGALARTYEAHKRGAILVDAVFSAMMASYQRRSRDLLRIATGGTGILPDGYLMPDLVSRLAAEARKTAKHFLNMCIRALDYCPPVDIDFGEFLRALVTADRELEPDDQLGYRAALIDAFRQRGIYPRFAFSLAEDSVVWEPFSGRPDTTGIDFGAIRFGHAVEPEEARGYRMLFQDFVNRKRNKRLFRLSGSHPAVVQSVQPLRRIGPDRRIHNEIVVEVLQTGDKLASFPGAPPFRAGTTLIVSDQGKVRYTIYKLFDTDARRERQRAYLADMTSRSSVAAYRSAAMRFSLARIHRSG